MMSCCYQCKEKCQLLNPWIHVCPKVLNETEWWMSFSFFFFFFFLSFFNGVCFIHSRMCPLLLHIAGMSKISKGLRLLYATGQSCFHHFYIKYHLWNELFCIHLLYRQKPISYLFLWRNFMFSTGLHYGMDIIWLIFDP